MAICLNLLYPNEFSVVKIKNRATERQGLLWLHIGFNCVFAMGAAVVPTMPSMLDQNARAISGFSSGANATNHA